MVNSDRESAWRSYEESLHLLHVAGESLENAEIDFKAGFDAATALALGRPPLMSSARSHATTRKK